MTYLGRLFRPIQSLSRASTNIAQAAVGLERVRAVLDADERLPRSPNAKPLEISGGRVEFHDVSFGYAPGRVVLQDVSFTAEPGQLIGLVGPSGSGKSTLVSLIPRFYDPVGGSVSIDGQDIREVTIRSLRRQIAFVLQETQLFYAPVWQNIAYGKPDATRDEIVRAAELAQAHEFIEALAEGYDTMLGQGGLMLSGGQRQRIGIARAIVRDARILLMDEPSSGLDSESERLVFEGLRNLQHGRTTFVIAHRLSTIRNADQVLVLDHGRIVERGRHAELVALGGLYARIEQLQDPDEPHGPGTRGRACERHPMPSRSPRSLGRPVARLLRMKSSRPMKSTSTSPNGWRTRRGQASANVRPVRSVRRSMRPGGTPI
jgi:ATP-binding cassette subfamily B protein